MGGVPESAMLFCKGTLQQVAATVAASTACSDK